MPLVHGRETAHHERHDSHEEMNKVNHDGNGVGSTSCPSFRGVMRMHVACTQNAWVVVGILSISSYAYAYYVHSLTLKIRRVSERNFSWHGFYVMYVT